MSKNVKYILIFAGVAAGGYLAYKLIFRMKNTFFNKNWAAGDAAVANRGAK